MRRESNDQYSKIDRHKQSIDIKKLIVTNDQALNNKK